MHTTVETERAALHGGCRESSVLIVPEPDREVLGPRVTTGDLHVMGQRRIGSIAASAFSAAFASAASRWAPFLLIGVCILLEAGVLLVGTQPFRPYSTRDEAC